MAARRQLTPIEVFEANMGDAERLVAFARGLANSRSWTRIEKKRAVGDALGIARKHHASLACVESTDVFVVIKPDSRVHLSHFTEPELRPLLRQAVVAASAAIESYVAEKASTYASAALDSRPDRLKDVMVSLDHVVEIEARYKRRRVGHRAMLREHIELTASPSPSAIGLVFATVGHKDVLKRVDAHRGLARGASAAQLETLYRRRNRIAHTGDRTATGRASLSLAEVEEHIANARSIIVAMEAVLS